MKTSNKHFLKVNIEGQNKTYAFSYSAEKTMAFTLKLALTMVNIFQIHYFSKSFAIGAGLSSSPIKKVLQSCNASIEKR